MAAPPQTSRPASWPLSWISRWHHIFVFERRTRVLAEMLAAQIPQRASVVDIGSADGTIGSLVAQLRRNTFIQSVEFFVRPGCKIECHRFDGSSFSFPDASLDVCLLMDVLHNT